MDIYSIFGIAVAAAILIYWLLRRRSTTPDATPPGDRIDTLIGWPPEATRILRTSERLAYSTLRLALPGYMILAQVPISRFINVPKRYSYAEWMRRLGSQCVDFVICDVTSQVVAVVDVRPPDAQISDRLRRRLDRVSRSLKAVSIPLHVWNEESLPSVEAARASIVPNAPAVPIELASRRSAAEVAHARNAFVDTDRDPAHEDVEVIELGEPRSSTWFDELDSESSSLPPPTRRTR
jgi:hypothetical protein